VNALDDKKVKDYFDDIAVEFDNIYDTKGGVLTKLADKIFRKSLYERFS